MKKYIKTNNYIPETYLTSDIANSTKYKSIKDAYERNKFSVIQNRGHFYIEGFGIDDRTYNLIIKETKRLYPYLTYLYEDERV